MNQTNEKDQTRELRSKTLNSATEQLDALLAKLTKANFAEVRRKIVKLADTCHALADGMDQGVLTAAGHIEHVSDLPELKKATNALIDAITNMLAAQSGVKFEHVDEIPCSLIGPGPNDRKEFDPAALESLANSIQARGLTQPIIVRPWPASRAKENTQGWQFELIAGERRLRSIKDVLQKATAPCIVRQMSDEEASMAMMDENTNRVDLNAIEEANAFQIRMDKYGLTWEALAKETGKTEIYIQLAVKLLKLIPDIQQMVIDGHLLRGYAQAIAHAELDEYNQRRAMHLLSENKAPSLVWLKQLVGALKAGQDQLVMDLMSAATTHQVGGDDGTEDGNGKKKGKKRAAPTIPTPADGRPVELEGITGTKVEVVEAHIAFWKRCSRQLDQIGRNFKRDQCDSAIDALKLVLADLR